jgi:hypothetical protein
MKNRSSLRWGWIATFSLLALQGCGQPSGGEQPSQLTQPFPEGHDYSKCDFDGDRICDIISWEPSSGNWHVRRSSDGVNITQQWGAPEDIPVPGDYDGDGRTDFAVWRPSSGNWIIIMSSTGAVSSSQWGLPEDIPVPRRYDGDDKTDLATWRPSTHTFAVRPSAGGADIAKVIGQSTDIPVPVGDYDGDLTTDFAVWTPDTGIWTILQSSNNTVTTPQWGAPEDIPVPADYDADNIIDLAVWRPSTGNWLIAGQSDPIQWGLPEDLPAPGDYDGDGITDPAILRPSSRAWALALSTGASPPTASAPNFNEIPVVRTRLRARSSDYDGDGKTDFTTWRHSTAGWAFVNSHDGTTGSAVTGISGDLALEGDFDGDRRTDPVTYHPATGIWTIKQSSDGSTNTPQWGAPWDIPVPGDYDGDGKTDLAVWRGADPGGSAPQWLVSGSWVGTVAQTLGAREDVPVQADYDGDGKTDPAIWEPTTGNWKMILSSTGAVAPTKQWGAVGDIPAPADYDGDHKADFATWRPSTKNWAIIFSSSGGFANKTLGAIGDVPVPADYDGDGRSDVAVWTPSSGNWKVILSSTGATVTRQWGLPEDVPASITLPAWPWFYAPATTTTLTGMTTVVADHRELPLSGGWEYSSIIAAPGTSGCTSGRRYLSGQQSGVADMRYASLTCGSTDTCTTADVAKVTLPSSPPSGLESDNMLARRKDGTLLLARGLVLNPSPQTTATRSSTGIWALSPANCGTDTWQRLAIIDPQDRTRYAPPGFPGDPNASYGTPQGVAPACPGPAGTICQMGGWDREELYADPFSNNVYLTMTGNGGTDPANGGGPIYADTLLFRSADGGTNWGLTYHDVGEKVVPVMMTAIPGRLFLFTCRAAYPYLWWSDDNGVTLKGNVRFSNSELCGGGQWGVDGSTSISRVRWSADKTATIRVVYPVTHSDNRQRFAIFNIRVTGAGAVYPTFVREVSVSNTDVLQVSQVEPDVSMSGLSTDNTSLIFWKEMSAPGVAPQVARTRGMLVRDELQYSAIFNVSTTSSGNARSWPSTAKTGDYDRGAFYYDSSSMQLRYFIPWIEVTWTGAMEMHTKIVGIRR